MKNLVIAGVVAGVLIAGLIFSPLLNTDAFNAQAQSTGKTKKVTLIADEVEVQVAPDNALHPGGIKYNAMVFNGTIPSPVISVDQGDTLEITVRNEGQVIHSVDFHAGIGPSQALSGNVNPGESKTWTMKAENAGVFFYHCGADGLNGVWEHIANGMYGGIVVHPKNEKPAKEFYMVFGEIYNSADKGVFVGTNGTAGTFDIAKFLNGNPDLVITNGMAHKYVPSIGEEAKITLNEEAEIFKVKPGEQTRWYIINAGPNDGVAFHFISGIIDVRDGSIKNRYGTQLINDETWWIPPGSASVIESVFPEEGIYVGVDHAMNDVVKGAAFAVQATGNATDNDHPAGTWVPPRGSDVVSGPSTVNVTAGGINATGAGNNVTEAETGNNVTEAETGNNVTEAAETEGNATGNITQGQSMTGANATGANATGANATGANATGASGNEVSIAQGSSSPSAAEFFVPEKAQVTSGTTVTWKNNDNTIHTVVSGTAESKTDLFESPIIAAGGTFQYTFDTPGTYDYFCSLHPFMKGQVQVS